LARFTLGASRYACALNAISIERTAELTSLSEAIEIILRGIAFDAYIFSNAPETAIEAL
jgi:hypothetical protein